MMQPEPELIKHAPFIVQTLKLDIDLGQYRQYHWLS